MDPFGARAEWEGFVAVVNKEQSKKFNALVDAAPELIKDLPWGPDFEGAFDRMGLGTGPDLGNAVGTFQRPDFTALEIIAFATGGSFFVFARIASSLTLHSGKGFLRGSISPTFPSAFNVFAVCLACLLMSGTQRS